jgi:hypothetical protein
MATTVGTPPSRADPADDLADVRGGARQPGALCRAVRRFPLRSGDGVEDLHGPLRKHKYSVLSMAVGRPVDVHAYAEKIAIRQDDANVGEHPHCFGRGETVYDERAWPFVASLKPAGRPSRRASIAVG